MRGKGGAASGKSAGSASQCCWTSADAARAMAVVPVDATAASAFWVQLRVRHRFESIRRADGGDRVEPSVAKVLRGRPVRAGVLGQKSVKGKIT